ncbi:MAG TPA: TrbG/VirB9 family P-type conjugative transfer protein [Allosphingosinicella sp.]|nr:TrbG/VirB9 family P-type conjugative transfer protein [Allosphingosinicella sp.]
MKLLALSAAALIFAAAAAPVTATAATPDARVQSVLFTPDTVIRFVGQPGYQSAIRFGPDEQIENIAVGDSMSWQVTPNRRGNLLFVKPMVPGARSNMTVIADRRIYLFDLESPARGQPIYTLSFEYPVWPAPGAVAPPPPTPEAEAAIVAVAAAAEPPAPPVLNHGWTSRGTRALLPAQAYDDGHSLYLSWPANSALPAILVPAADGTEGPVNYRVEGAQIIIDGVPARLVLRRGDERATITSNLRSAARGNNNDRR